MGMSRCVVAQLSMQIVESRYSAHIHTFSSHHHEQVARALLEAKAAVDATDEAGWTALMYAAQNGHEQVRFAV